MTHHDIIDLVFSDEYSDKISLIHRIPDKHLWEAMFPQIDAYKFANQLDSEDISAFNLMIRSALSEVNVSEFMRGLPLSVSDGKSIDAVMSKLLAHINNPYIDKYVRPIFIDKAPLLEISNNECSVNFREHFRDSCSFFGNSGASWRIDLRFPSYDEWFKEVLGSIDVAYDKADAGHTLDACLFLLETEHLASSVPYSSRDTRFRFCDAVLKNEDDGREAFLRSYYRRSAAMSLLEDVRRAISGIEGGKYGMDENGWPIWWSGNFARPEDVTIAIDRYAAGAAQAVFVGVPESKT